MAEYSRFFGGPEDDVPEYTQPQFAEVLAKLFSNGVFANVAEELEVIELSGMIIRVKPGEGWINGFWYQNDDNEGTDPLTKTLVSDPVNPKIDRIVLRLDTIGADPDESKQFKITVSVLEGTPNPIPVLPDLADGDDGIWEIPLAHIHIEAAADTIAHEDIEDERDFAGVPEAVNADTVDTKHAADLVQIAGNQTIAGIKSVSDGAIVTVPKSYTPAGGGNATLNLSLGNQHNITMPAGNITIVISNATVGQKFIVTITQDGTGSRTVTWFITIKWVGGSAPTLTTAANKRDTFGFIVTGDGTYDGFVIGQNI